MSEPGLPVFENRRLPGPHVGLCFPPHFVDKAIYARIGSSICGNLRLPCAHVWGMSSPPPLAPRVGWSLCFDPVIKLVNNNLSVGP